MDNVRSFYLIAVDGLKDEYLCAEGFGVGLIPALIKRRAKQKRADGPEDVRRGGRVLREIVVGAEPLDIEVGIDGEALKGNLLGVEILTGPFTGPALPFAHAPTRATNCWTSSASKPEKPTHSPPGSQHRTTSDRRSFLDKDENNDPLA